MPTVPSTRFLRPFRSTIGESDLVRFAQGQTDEETDSSWKLNVLRNATTATATLRLPEGASRLKLWAVEPGVVIQRIALDGLSEKTEL